MSLLRRWVPFLFGPREDGWGLPTLESRWAAMSRRLRSVSRLDWAISVGSLAVVAAAAVLLVPLPAARGWGARVEVGAAALTGLIVGLLLLAAQVRVQADRDRRDALREEEDRKRELRLTLSVQDRLMGVDLRERDLTELVLVDKMLQGADLRGAVLSGTSFVGSNLSRAKLHGASGSWAKFDTATMELAVIDQCDLPHASFEGADLREVRVFTSTLPEAYFKDAALQNAKLSGLKAFQSNFERTRLAGAEITDCCLADTSWSGADFGDADLFKVDLSGADLRGANLGGATLEFCDLTGACANEGTSWPVGFDDARLREEHVGAEPVEDYDAALMTRWALQAHRGEPIDALRMELVSQSDHLGGYPWELIRLAGGPEDDPPAAVYARFGRRLERVRTIKGVSVAELAELARVSPERVLAWEGGHPIRLDELGALITLTGTTPGRIFGGFRAGVPIPKP